MSFSGNVKEEISKTFANARHCQLAELRGYLQFCGKLMVEEGKSKLVIETDNALIYRKCFTILKKTFNIVSINEPEEEVSEHGHYSIELMDSDEVWNILQSLKLMEEGVLTAFTDPISSMLIKNSCCKRAYLKTAYMCAGSMSDPNKGYHLEFVCDYESQANQIRDILGDFGIEAKVILRKKYYVVYIKEAECIVDFLNVCEAVVSLMELENLRIVKDVRNNINRQVNCDAANIAKAVNAATKQIEDIKLLRDRGDFDSLPYNLREMAEVRLAHPEEPLAELGQYFDPPLGKSGVNHRLRKLSELAEKIGYR